MVKPTQKEQQRAKLQNGTQKNRTQKNRTQPQQYAEKGNLDVRNLYKKQVEELKNK